MVTAVAARTRDEDLPPLESALRNAGADVTIAEWDRPHDWSRFDIALLRSTWDYPQRLLEFLDWAGAVSRVTTLLNPELLVGARALKALPFATPLYARVDLIRDQQGEPVVLELVEPSLLFPFAVGSAEKFAAAVVRRVGLMPAPS